MEGLNAVTCTAAMLASAAVLQHLAERKHNSLHTVFFVARSVTVRFSAGFSSRPDWHLRHLDSRLNWGAYSDIPQAVALVGELRAYPAGARQSDWLRAPVFLVTRLSPQVALEPLLVGFSTFSPPGQYWFAGQRLQDVAVLDCS